MCAHKDGVEDARHETDAQKAYARDSDRPCRDDGSGDQVPGREVGAHPADGCGNVEQIVKVA